MNTLLIVDDSNIIRSKIARATRNSTLDELSIVGMAGNGVEAVRLCQQTMPDLVTMDLTMPEMDGIACIEALVKMKPDILILVISALADKGTAIEALKKGAHGFLCKPFSDEQLESAFRELLQDLNNE